MKKFHISFYAYKKNDPAAKMKRYQETIIEESEEKAFEKLQEQYHSIRKKLIGAIDATPVTYGVLYELTKRTLDNAKTNLYKADGRQKSPAWVHEHDTYILFEKTIREDHTEYYSNAWSDSEYEAIVKKLKKFQTWHNHIDETNSYGAGIGDRV